MAASIREQQRTALRKRLREQADEFLACRDLRHAWETTSPFYTVTPAIDANARDTRIVRDLVCTRCGTIRRDSFQNTKHGLEKFGTSYGYPDGYQMEGMVRGVKPAALIREEEYRRVLARKAQAATRRTA